jgi:hypothetical protein
MSNNFQVQVELKMPEPNVFQVVIIPERLYLDGREGSKITWTPVRGTIFRNVDDIDFVDAADKFTKTFNTDGTITATVNGTDPIEKIYVYFVTLRRQDSEFAVKVDPEVDNPPPPPDGT